MEKREREERKGRMNRGIGTVALFFLFCCVGWLGLFFFFCWGFEARSGSGSGSGSGGAFLSLERGWLILRRVEDEQDRTFRTRRALGRDQGVHRKRTRLAN